MEWLGDLQVVCERFALWSAWSNFQAMYGLADVKTDLASTIRLDFAPTENVLFVTAGEQGYNRLHEGRWGLVPWTAKEIPKQFLHNAHVDIVDTSSAFKDAWVSKRCLIPANGFFAAGKDGSSWLVHQAGGRPFSFAGLWAHNGRLGITSCAMVTKRTEAPIQTLQDRQPVVLSPDVYNAWLDCERPATDLRLLLDRSLNGTLEYHLVRNDDAANNLGNDVADSRFAKPTPIMPAITKNQRRPRAEIYCCEHEGCRNGGLWACSSTRDPDVIFWFCYEHRDDVVAKRMVKQKAAVGASRN